MTSWLFGSNRNQYPQNFNEYIPPASGDGGGKDGGDNNEDKKKSKEMEAYRFDSSALERAAKAAKELENSSYSVQALELSKQQEITKQKEMMTRAEEIRLQIEAQKKEASRLESEELKRRMQMKAELDERKSQHDDQLARKREEYKMERFRAIEEERRQKDRAHEEERRHKDLAHEDERRRKDEESVAKIEAQRTVSMERDRRIEYEYKRKLQVEQIAEQAKASRENHDLNMEKLKVEFEQKRQTALESIRTISSAIGSGFNTLISDPKKLMYTVGGLTALVAGFYTAKGSLGLLFRVVEARVATPSLIRETSRITPLDILKHPILTAKTFKEKRRSKDVMEGIKLDEKLEVRLRDIALATKNTKINKGLYRNLLLYGPPGTGKTLFAKQLAKHSNMNYAILSGGDVAMLKGDSVTAIHKVFDWASSSRKGLVLFVDEAEGFLRKRHEDISENLRMAINAFLFQTGTPSNKFMMVLASNTPEIFDNAVVDRVHEAIRFDPPDQTQRERLVQLYFDKYILGPAISGKSRLKLEDKFLDKAFYKDICGKIAEKTDGFSAREITNLALDWQMTTYASQDGVLTWEIMQDRLESAVESKVDKVSWYSKEEEEKQNYSKLKKLQMKEVKPKI